MSNQPVANTPAPTPVKFQMPHTLVLVALLVGLVLVASWFLPSGEFQRATKVVGGTSRLVTVPGTFHYVGKVFLGPQTLMTAPVQGFVHGALLIAFLFAIGGSFQVLQATGAIDAGIRRMAKGISGHPKLEWMLIPALMVVFSLAGSIFGMAESGIPFVLIFIPLARSLGYDALVGMSIPFLGAAAGFAAAFFNPFTVGIAQRLAELPINSGFGYRVFTWVVGTTVMIAYVMFYADRVKRNPELSVVRDLELEYRNQPAPELEARLERRQVLVLGVFGATMAFLVWGILVPRWDIDAIAALFLAMGVVAGLAGGLAPGRIATSFVEGARSMVGVVCIVACARALLIIGRDALVLDTLLHYGATVLGYVPRILTAHAMFLIQAIINFFVHSGSAQAALTMPIMAPLADLLGITRQTAVYAFQLCEFINPILPTSAVTMGVLGAARIPWERWAKWFLPLMLILVVLSFLLLIPPVLMRWGPF